MQYGPKCNPTILSGAQRKTQQSVPTEEEKLAMLDLLKNNV